MQKLIRLKLPAFVILIPVLAWLAFILFTKNPSQKIVIRDSTSESVSDNLEFIRKRSHKLVQPLMLAGSQTESHALMPLKAEIWKYLEQKIAAGQIKIGSVCFSDLTQGRSISINPFEQYDPGSIIKLSILITYLKEAESNPHLLDKKIYFAKPFAVIPEQMIEERIVPQQNYTVKQLMERMIIYSDNDATALLNQTINLDHFKELYASLSLPKPDLKSWDYFLTAEQCSRFLSVLFNSTYLNEQSSDYAMNLLTCTRFSNGITRYLDSTVLCAHKFGERNFQGEQQLHETGIFYLDDAPYLLTVMTKGNNREALPVVLSDISRLVYDYRKKKNS